MIHKAIQIAQQSCMNSKHGALLSSKNEIHERACNIHCKSASNGRVSIHAEVHVLENIIKVDV